MFAQRGLTFDSNKIKMVIYKFAKIKRNMN